MARLDRIGWTHHKGARPEHRGGFPNRYDIAMENLTKGEAEQVLALLGAMQEDREPVGISNFAKLVAEQAAARCPPVSKVA